MAEEQLYRRRNYFIDKKFQAKFITKFSLIVVISAFFIGILSLFLSYDSTTVTIENSRVLAKKTGDFILPIMIQILFIVSVFSAVAVALLTMYTSHKIAGPLFRIKREVDLMEKGDLRVEFRIRKEDQLQELAVALRSLASSQRGKHSRLNVLINELDDVLSKSGAKSSEANSKLEEVREILGYFKV